MSTRAIIYLDTSAAAKLVVREQESDVLRRWLGNPRLIASALLEAELIRAVRRHPPDSANQARALLRRINLVPIDQRTISLAAILEPPTLRTLDALHLATALLLELTDLAFVSYDERLTQAADAAGLQVTSPT